MRRLRASVAGAACAAALAGCQAADSDRAVGALREFLAAIDRGEGAVACERLSEKGLSELVHVALSEDVPAPPASATHPCAELVARLPPGPAGALRRAEVEDVVLHERTALVDTTEGTFELEEREGRWELSGLEALAEALAGERGDDVSIFVVRPRFPRPALGATRARTTTADDADVTGVVSPPGARIEVRPEGGGEVERVETQGDRFRIRLRLRPGANAFRLRGTAPGHRASELVLRLRRR